MSFPRRAGAGDLQQRNGMERAQEALPSTDDCLDFYLFSHRCYSESRTRPPNVVIEIATVDEGA